MQVAIFAFAAWAGSARGGVIAGLSVCGLVMASTSSAATLMQARFLLPHCFTLVNFSFKWSDIGCTCGSLTALFSRCMSMFNFRVMYMH